MEELSRISYIWGADQNKREIVDMSMYSPYSKDFECIHKYAFYGFFKPSIAEVLAQIPENQVNFMDAFEIISYPETAGDFTENSIVFKNGFHISIVRLYTKLK